MTASPTPQRPTLKGVFAASLSPMRPDGSVDLDAFVAHGKWLLANGCDGLAPLGTTGEANSIGMDDRLKMIEAAGKALPMDKVLFGTGSTALADAVKLTKASLKAGCANVLMLPPFYYKNPADEGVFRFYSEVIQQVGDANLHVYLYHFPQHAVVGFPLPLAERLIKAYPKTIVGLKDSSGDWASIEAFCKEFPGFATFSGTEGLLNKTLAAGGAGCISATTNITAPLAQQVYAAYKTGKDATAVQEELTKARMTLQKYPLFGALKALTRRRTGNEVWRTLMPPNLPLDQGTEDKLVAELQSIGFFDQIGAPAIAAS